MQTKMKDTEHMKSNVTLKTVATIAIVALTLVGKVFGQTSDDGAAAFAQLKANTAAMIERTLAAAAADSSASRTMRRMGKDPIQNGPHPMDVTVVPDYHVVDLGTLGGSYSYAQGVNNSGQVVGGSMTSSNERHAFLYSNGLMHDLGTFGGNDSEANAINNSGQVVGCANIASGFGNAFLYQNGSLQHVGEYGNYSSHAYGINDIGQVVGIASDSSIIFIHAFLWQNGSIRDLGKFGDDYGQATGINNNCQIIGTYVVNGVEEHAFMYQNGYKQDLGTLGGILTIAYGINNGGQVVGMSYDSSGNYAHAFLWQNGAMTDLEITGDVNSEAHSINNNGQVVGDTWNSAGNNFHAFLWQNGTTYDLNTLLFNAGSGWTLQFATGINDKGQIVGYGLNPQGQTHAFLLNPVDHNDLPTIQAGKTHPAYGDGIMQQQDKDSLVVITHGRIPPSVDPNVSTAWVDSMSNSVVQYMSAHNLGNWQVKGHKWIKGAKGINNFPQDFQNILNNAKMDGINLGNSIVAAGNWTHVHLIAHSAGSELIQACSEVIRSHLQNTVTIQCTFLDPFTGILPSPSPIYNSVAVYGNQADWSDDYFTVDQETGGSDWPVTQGHIDHAYAVDVTYLDPHKTLLNGYVQVSGIVSGACQKTETTHGWPIDFYSNTISGSVSSEYLGFGFLLSKEVMGSSWSSLPTSYLPGNNLPQPLGTPDPDCVPMFRSNSGKPPSDPINMFNAGQNEVQIEEGLLQKMDTGLNMSADDPAWLARFILLTNPVNYIAFDARFTTVPQGAGELSVYWDTNAIGFIDEKLVGLSTNHYVFSFPPASANSTHMLGFRLDDTATNVVTTISITNVVMAYVGVSQPFSLSFTTNTYNGLPVLQMTGEPGFNYKVQATTNIANPNWSDIAVLINSNGVVPFIDPDSTNYGTRFYRVVAPY
jgi:probable HAF family extracellular repeat protein